MHYPSRVIWSNKFLKLDSAEMILRLQIPPSRKPENTLKPFIPNTITAADSGLQFRRKILYLQSLRVHPEKALHKNPNLRSAPLSSLHSITNCLLSMGIELSAIGRIIDMYPKLLTSDPYEDIYPRILVSDLETQLKPALEFLTQLGFTGPNKITSHTALLLVSSVESTLIPKIEYLMGLGFMYDEVRIMVLRSPGLLTFSVENNYRPKMEYFLNEMNGDLEEIKRFPQYFSYSLERKIKHRHRLLMELGLSMPLSAMLKVSDGEFEKRLQMVVGRPL